MDNDKLFIVLDQVDSTNNYAMGRCKEGLAVHGSCWYAKHQTEGKGQRGKNWESEAGSNIAMSLVIAPNKAFKRNPFLLSALVANTCREFITDSTGIECCTIKWPNDIYLNDKKTAGILLETIFQGSVWSWCVIGIGINVNQQVFSTGLQKATSLKKESTGKFEPLVLAKNLYTKLLLHIDEYDENDGQKLVKKYNDHLFLKNQETQLKKDQAVFTTLIKEVDEFGTLHTADVMERKFQFGDVEWVL